MNRGLYGRPGGKGGTRGGGGGVNVISDTTLASAVASIVVPNVSSAYSMLEVVLQCRCDAAAGHSALYVRCNGDGGSNYDWMGTDGNTAADNKIRVGSLPGATGSANYSANMRLWIPNHGGTVFCKTLSAITSYIGVPVSDGGAETLMGIWRSTNEVTTLEFFTSSGNFVTGTRCTAYGYP